MSSIRHLITRKVLKTSGLRSRSSFHYGQRKNVSDVKVIIVGAGLSGLSAAKHLISHGFHNTIIIEATERCGGRIRSKQFGDAFCELGAKWVAMNTCENSMYELLRNMCGVTQNIPQQKNLCYVDTNGERVNKKLSELIHMLFRKVILEIELVEKYKNGDLHDLNSVHTYFQSEINKLVPSLFESKNRDIAKGVFISLTKDFGSILGDCLEYVNIEHITKLKDYNISPIYIPSGLDCVLKEITTEIKPDHISTGKPVGTINWGGGRQEEKSVGCLDGSAFAADHIICTLPLGVLKNFSNYMFKPMLPKEKQRAIKNLGFGTPVKIFFEYKEDVNPWFSSSFCPLWKQQELGNDLQWTKQIVEILKLPKSSRVLEVRVGGQFYNKIERLPDTEVLQEVTQLMRTRLKNPKIPYPHSILRSNWSSSSCYLGGRPYFSIGSSVSDINTLAAPLGDKPNLMFAGDATILDGFGTIDGARLSGIREAERVINYYNRGC